MLEIQHNSTIAGDPNFDTADVDHDPRTFFACHDIQYNVTMLLLGNTQTQFPNAKLGDVVERYEYTPYGQRQVYTSAGTSDPDCFKVRFLSQRLDDPAAVESPVALCTVGFQGLHLDEITGNYNNRARIYNPTSGGGGQGRFLQRDPLGYPDGMNTYAAYHVMRQGVDPSGMDIETGIFEGSTDGNLHDMDRAMGHDTRQQMLGAGSGGSMGAGVPGNTPLSMPYVHGAGPGPTSGAIPKWRVREHNITHPEILVDKLRRDTEVMRRPCPKPIPHSRYNRSNGSWHDFAYHVIVGTGYTTEKDDGVGRQSLFYGYTGAWAWRRERTYIGVAEAWLKCKCDHSTENTWVVEEWIYLRTLRWIEVKDVYTRWGYGTRSQNWSNATGLPIGYLADSKEDTWNYPDYPYTDGNGIIYGGIVR